MVDLEPFRQFNPVENRMKLGFFAVHWQFGSTFSQNRIFKD